MTNCPILLSMPRTARIDIPGLLQHVIARGIERRHIFLDDQDKGAFLCRFGQLLQETDTDCYAWALLDNHFHLLLRPKSTTLAQFMRRLLTGYAVEFNLRHNRSGHLFQNRFKSIVCDQDAYLLELIRYIHLNPVRAGMVKNLDSLDRYPWCGHGMLLGENSFPPQQTDQPLAMFSNSRDLARKKYRQFIADGLSLRHASNLSGGGKKRSLVFNPALEGDNRFDDRILGGGDFVENLVGIAIPEIAPAPRLSLGELLEKVSAYYGVSPNHLLEPNKNRQLGRIKGVVCYLALRQFGYSGEEVSQLLPLSPSGVSIAAKRGAKVVEEDEPLRGLICRKIS